jgi:hypothetical protein
MKSAVFCFMVAKTQQSVYVCIVINAESQMGKLVASTFIGNGLLWLFLDNNVVMQNSDRLTLEIGEEETYNIYWFVKGAPGSPYSITISSPHNAQFQITRIIGKGGKDHGGFQFHVKH